MTDENKLIRDRNLASRAAILLDDELLKGAFDALEKAYTDEMINTGVAAGDSYARDRLHQAIHIVRKVKVHLQRVMENGKLAKAELIELEGKRSRAKAA